MKNALRMSMMVATLIAMTGCNDTTQTVAATTQAPAAKPVKIQSPEERGHYLVSIMGCNDCHTPWKMGANGPEPDMDRFLSGHPEELGPMPPTPSPKGPWVWTAAGTNTAFAGPWGVTYTKNLTPDKLTGLGIWTEEMFVKAIREGKHWGTARPIMPPMPWQVYRNATDEDLRAIFAYLKTIKPITNNVPDYEPPPATPAGS